MQVMLKQKCMQREKEESCDKQMTTKGNKQQQQM